MKKKFFLPVMLAGVAASAQVTHVEPISATYKSQTVSFRVWWNAGSRDATHLSKVWVWVDYITVNSNNATSGNSWTRAAVSAASPTSSVTYDGSNRQGFWLQGNSGSYSATVTVKLNITENNFNWCAYASDYPPNVIANNGSYTLRGTPPFTLIAASGTPTQTVSGTIITTSAVTITPVTITDQTGCPGVFCPYQGSDLFIDATHLCQQRASGAQNWEAYIKDNRDDQIYRITQFSDASWWFADDLGIADKSVGTCNGKHYYLGQNKPTCPSGWQLPTDSQLLVRFPNPTTDAHGAQITAGYYYGKSQTCGYTGCNDANSRYDLIASDANNTRAWFNLHWDWNCTGGQNAHTGIAARARCIRNL
ncbi:MAG: hypothetical protein LBU42_10350 [Prevotellaceae bacterium]|jgi:hypothetical protein|nr:hypothetical protein [Prevotellaceae bacterium]